LGLHVVDRRELLGVELLSELERPRDATVDAEVEVYEVGTGRAIIAAHSAPILETIDGDGD
jgi:hypothetical protein